MDECICRREGDYWTFEFDARVVRVRDSRGVRYVASLLRHPGAALHASALRSAAFALDGAKPPKTITGGAAAERARLSVTKGIAGAIARLGAMHPVLGAHLRATIRRGYFCSYAPTLGIRSCGESETPGTPDAKAVRHVGA